MVIHIEFDIKITDKNGIVVQSTGNHYEENVASDTKQVPDTILDIDFSDFLAEYLSSSGFFLREKLLKGYNSGKQKCHASPKAMKKDIIKRKSDCKDVSEEKISDDNISDENITDENITDENILNLLEGMELEYKIRIGKNKVLIGKIPLKSEADNNSEKVSSTVSASIVPEEQVMEGNSDNDESPDFEDADSCDEDFIETETADDDEEINLFESSYSTEDTNVSETSAHDSDPTIYNFLKYSMMKAIEKYEDNIYNVWYETSTDMEPVMNE